MYMKDQMKTKKGGDEIEHLSANQLLAERQLALQQSDNSVSLVDTTTVEEHEHNETATLDSTESQGTFKNKVKNAASAKTATIKWKESEDQVSDSMYKKVMGFQPTDNPLLHNLNNEDPVEVFELFFDDDLAEKIFGEC